MYIKWGSRQQLNQIILGPHNQRHHTHDIIYGECSPWVSIKSKFIFAGYEKCTR